MASQCPYAFYVKFLKVGKERYVSQDDWKRINCKSINNILQHLCTWKNTGNCPPRVAVVHELCALKGIPIRIRAGRLQMMQILIPKLMSEMTECVPAYEHPVPKTNVSKTIMTPPAAVINTPVGYSPQLSSSTKLNMPKFPRGQQAIGRPQNRAPTWMIPAKRKQVTEQVGSMRFQNLDEYTQFLRVGKHVVHSSPCVRVQDISWRHRLTYEQWQKVSGGSGEWVCRCRRWRPPVVKAPKTVVVKTRTPSEPRTPQVDDKVCPDVSVQANVQAKAPAVASGEANDVCMMCA